MRTRTGTDADGWVHLMTSPHHARCGRRVTGSGALPLGGCPTCLRNLLEHGCEDQHHPGPAPGRREVAAVGPPRGG